ncbi:26S proteasome complex subunit [Coemansia sp. Benny D115]|nr:26S proteasome complex subunit [Coemansia sp. Benny D115]
MSTAPATTKNKTEQTGSVDPAQQKIPTPGALEDDDEFEEFEVEDWNEDAEDKEDVSLWDDNWDDDDLEDDFSKQLRVELEKASNPDNSMAISA